MRRAEARWQAGMPGPTSLTYRHRLHLAWELTWPLAAIDFAVVLAIHGLLEVPGETLDSVWALAAFFVVSPGVIRRAFRRSYGGSHLVAIRGGEEGGTLRYQESLKVMWLLAWRTLVLSLLALLLVSLLLRLAGLSGSSFSVKSPLANSLGLSAVDTLSSLVFTPLLAPAMIRKRYRGFHLELRQVPVPVRRGRGVPRVKKR
jgi:hypothetical protein